MPNLDVTLSGYLQVPAGSALTGPMEDRVTLPCGKELKFWLAVELHSDPANPDAEPRDLDSAELAALGVSGPEYDSSATLELGEEKLPPAENDANGQCVHCGRDNSEYPGAACSDECPLYWEVQGKPHPDYAPADKAGD